MNKISSFFACLLIIVGSATMAAPISFSDGDIYSGSFDLADAEFLGNAIVGPYDRIGASVGFDATNALDVGESITISIEYGTSLFETTFFGTASGLLGINTLSTVGSFAESTGTITVSAVGSFDLSSLGVLSKGTLAGSSSSILFELMVIEGLSKVAAVPVPAGIVLLLTGLAILFGVRRPWLGMTA